MLIALHHITDGTRTDAAESLQEIRYGSKRHAHDPCCDIHADNLRYTERMLSAVCDAPLARLH